MPVGVVSAVAVFRLAKMAVADAAAVLFFLLLRCAIVTVCALCALLRLFVFATAVVAVAVAWRFAFHRLARSFWFDAVGH